MVLSGAKKTTKSVNKAVEPVALLPNVLLLPAPHHRRWGWLVWTIILLGLLLGTIWWLRGCKPIPAPIVQADSPTAHYGSFELLEGGPSLNGVRDNFVSKTQSYYHATLPDGRIFFLADTSLRDYNEQTFTDPTFQSPDNGTKFSFVFDPKLNLFQDLPLTFDDPFGGNSYLLLKSGQLAVWEMDYLTERDTSGNVFNAGPGGYNPKLRIYDPFTGEKTEVLPTEDLSETFFARHPYMFELTDGLLFGALEHNEVSNGTAKQSTSVTFFYDYQTKQLTKKVGSIGLPDKGYTTAPAVILLGDQALILTGSNLYLFDYQTKTAIFKRRLPNGGAPQLGGVIPNSSLVWLANSISSSRLTSRSLVFLYNYATNNLYSYRLGDLPLKQGIAENISEGLAGSIPREEDEESETSNEVTLNEPKLNSYHLQPLADGTMLITGRHYYNLPWSFGLTTLISHQWLDRANSTDSPDTDQANNYASKIAETWSDGGKAYGCTVQESIPLSDGRVLFSGCRWFVYTPAKDRTASQLHNPSAFASQLGQVGHWSDGGKLLISDIQNPTNDPEYVLAGDAYSSFGTPYPLKDGRIFFFSPSYKTSSFHNDPDKDVLADDIIGQLYDPSSGKSRWVRSNVVKGKALFKRATSASITPEQNYFGVSDAKGNLHFIDIPSGQELIFYPASGKTKLRELKPADYGNQVGLPYITDVLSGPAVAIKDEIIFFAGANVGVLNIKTGVYADLAKQREALWLKRHPKGTVTNEVYQEITQGLPKFDAECTVINPAGGYQQLLIGMGIGALFPATKQTACGVESALDLGNQRILLTSGKQVKVFDYRKVSTEDIGALAQIKNVRRLFRMSDGRAVAIGPATLETGETSRSGEPMTTSSWSLEIIQPKQKTITAGTDIPNLLVTRKGLDLDIPAWMLPNDRVLFTLGSDRLSLYDLQKERWIAMPEAVVNLGYNNTNLIFQLPNHPMLVKIATKLDYLDYTKEIPLLSGDTLQPNNVVLPANAVEVFIPETGPWGYYDTSTPRFNWWLWFITLQVTQAFGVLVAILSKTFRRRFLVPL